MKKAVLCFVLCLTMVFSTVGAYATEFVVQQAGDNVITATEGYENVVAKDGLSTDIGNLKVVQDGDKETLMLTWEKISDNVFDGYIIRIPDLQDVIVAGDGALNVTLENIPIGVLHEIKVIPYSLNESNVMEESAPLVGYGIILKAPIVSASAGDSQATVSWEPVAGATSYMVVDALTEEIIAENLHTTTFDVKDLNNGEKYSYKVRAFVSVDGAVITNSAWSEVVEITPMDAVIGKPQNVTSQLHAKGVTLTWDAVEYANFYEVYKLNKEVEGQWDFVGETSTTEFKENNLTAGEEYTYKIKAYLKTDKFVREGLESDSITITAIGLTKVKITSKLQHNKGVTLKWNAVNGANKYYVYRYNKSAPTQWDLIKTTTKTEYVDNGLTVGRLYTYIVKAVYEDDEVLVIGTGSDFCQITAAAYHTADILPMTTKAKITKTTNLYVSHAYAQRSRKCGTIKKGKVVTVVERQAKFSKVKYGNKYYWISNSRYKNTSCIYNSSRDWCSQDKMDYINEKGYSSSTKYLIFISQYAQKVSVFQGSKGNWKHIKTFPCATGKATTLSPRGTYKVSYKEKGWYYKKYRCLHVTHWCNRNSFHTRPQSYKGKPTVATLGKPITNGCVRLYDTHAKWIHQNIPKGTTVVSY